MVCREHCSVDRLLSIPNIHCFCLEISDRKLGEDCTFKTTCGNVCCQCSTFVGTVTYTSPERIRSDNYSYPADIWSLGLAIFECGMGKFPYTAKDGPANLMLQILYDPTPTPSRELYSPEFCSFIDDCLQKDADVRPTADQMLAIHYYLLFDGADALRHYMKTFYTDHSTFSFSGKCFVGPNDIFATQSDIRKRLVGDGPREKMVHVVENLQCRPYSKDGFMIHVSGSFILGTHFIFCISGVQVEGMPSFEEPSHDIASNRMGAFDEQFYMEPGSAIGSYFIAKHELQIHQQ